jgi:hypothetical protein
MANPLSMLGIIHTLFSIVPIIAGLHGFSRYGTIRPETRSGQIYLVFLGLSVVTSFGLSSTGGFNAGHAIGILSLLAVGAALFLDRSARFGWLNRYLSALAMSFTFFLLMIPGINETLSRLPPANPIGQGPDSPAVQTATGIWALIFLIGLCYQMWTMSRTPISTVRPH